MAEVDYSRFYYKRERKENSGSPERDFDEPKRSEAERVERQVERTVERATPKRSRKPFLVIITLIIIFGIIFFAADFFTNGKLLDTVTASLRGCTYEYYFVVTETGGRDLAYAKSLLIKQMGGSGFIIDEDGKFLVVLSVYPDKSEAATVSSKNANTYVYTLSFTSKNTDFFNTVDKSVSDISTALKNLERGLLTESDCYGTLLAVKGELVKTKAAVLESASAAELNLLDYAIGGIDGLEMGKGTRLTFLSDARYVLCGIISSMGAMKQS